MRRLGNAQHKSSPVSSQREELSAAWQIHPGGKTGPLELFHLGCVIPSGGYATDSFVLTAPEMPAGRCRLSFWFDIILEQEALG